MISWPSINFWPENSRKQKECRPVKTNISLADKASVSRRVLTRYIKMTVYYVIDNNRDDIDLEREARRSRYSCFNRQSRLGPCSFKFLVDEVVFIFYCGVKGSSLMLRSIQLTHFSPRDPLLDVFLFSSNSSFFSQAIPIAGVRWKKSLYRPREAAQVYFSFLAYYRPEKKKKRPWYFSSKSFTNASGRGLSSLKCHPNKCIF